MAFSYSGNPAASDLDYLRFIIGDTDANDAMLQDAELNYVIDTTSVGNARIAKAFEVAATALGSRLVKRKLGPQSEDATDRHKYYVAQAQYYKTLSNYTVAPPSPEYTADKIFDKGMMSNNV